MVANLSPRKSTAAGAGVFRIGLENDAGATTGAYGRSGSLRATVPHGCNPDRNAEFDSQKAGVLGVME